MKRVSYHGTAKQTFVHQPHEDRVYVEVDSSQYEKDLYELNAKMRAAGIHRKDVRLHLQISEQDFTELCAAYPGLLRGSADDRRRTVEKIAKDRPWLVAKEMVNKYD